MTWSNVFWRCHFFKLHFRHQRFYQTDVTFINCWPYTKSKIHIIPVTRTMSSLSNCALISGRRYHIAVEFFKCIILVHWTPLHWREGDISMANISKKATYSYGSGVHESIGGSGWRHTVHNSEQHWVSFLQDIQNSRGFFPWSRWPPEY